MWIKTYPQDFAVEEIAQALVTLAEQIDAKPLLLGDDLQFFQYLRINVAVRDTEATRLPGQDGMGVKEQSGDQYDQVIAAILHPHPQAPLHPATHVKQSGSGHRPHQNPKVEGPLLTPVSGLVNDPWYRLRDIVNDVNALDPTQLAQEITRIGAELFLQINVCSIYCVAYHLYCPCIQPRHWLEHIGISVKKGACGRSSAVVAFNEMANCLAHWQVLWHDIKGRAANLKPQDCISHYLSRPTTSPCHANREIRSSRPGDSSPQQLLSSACFCCWHQPVYIPP